MLRLQVSSFCHCLFNSFCQRGRTCSSSWVPGHWRGHRPWQWFFSVLLRWEGKQQRFVSRPDVSLSLFSPIFFFFPAKDLPPSKWISWSPVSLFNPTHITYISSQAERKQTGTERAQKLPHYRNMWCWLPREKRPQWSTLLWTFWPRITTGSVKCLLVWGWPSNDGDNPLLSGCIEACPWKEIQASNCEPG